MSKARTYRFNTLKQALSVILPSVAAVGAMGAGLMMFSPVLAAAAGGCALYALAKPMMMSLPFYRHKIFEAGVKKGECSAVSDDTPFAKMVQDIGRDMQLRRPPRLYALSYDMIAKLSLPWGLKWLRHVDMVRNMIEEGMMPKFFAAVPGADAVVTTERAMKSDNFTSDELKFIVAHEMAHLKVDEMSIATVGEIASDASVKAVAVGGAVSMVLAASGVAAAAPVAAGVLPALGIYFGISRVAKMAFSYASRVKERRADRNALYITRDLPSAQSTMEKLHSAKDKETLPLIKEAYRSHPTFRRRMASLSQSFNVVAAYPVRADVQTKNTPAPKV